MSKEEWFRNFEQREAEHPELDDEQLSDLAMQDTIDQAADQADMLVDAAKEEGWPTTP